MSGKERFSDDRLVHEFVWAAERLADALVSGGALIPAKSAGALVNLQELCRMAQAEWNTRLEEKQAACEHVWAPIVGVLKAYSRCNKCGATQVNPSSMPQNFGAETR
jgi:hypothetical protein